jgi:F-type H+-transporting ATPase subunit alpha
MKNAAGGLRLQLAAFRELEAFAQLGTDLDAATQSQLDRGYRMVEILKQGQYKPLSVVDQILMIFAGTKGLLDDVPIKEVSTWEEEFLVYMQTVKKDVWDLVDKNKDVGSAFKGEDETSLAVAAAVKDFKAQYQSSTPETATA